MYRQCKIEVNGKKKGSIELLAHDATTYILFRKMIGKRNVVNIFFPSIFRISIQNIALNASQWPEKVSGFSIQKIGLVICRSEPWLAYSADGILLKNGKPYGLLEIKCPFKAKQASDLGNCKYIIKENNNYELKKNINTLHRCRWELQS